MTLTKAKIFLAATFAAPVSMLGLSACAGQPNPDLACRINADGGAETYSKQTGEVIYQMGDVVNQTNDTIYGPAFRVGATDIEAPPQVDLTANRKTRECYIGNSPDTGIPMTGPDF